MHSAHGQYAARFSSLDEIGDLSESLREMTDALWKRMEAIESFAADVAHEIKNPLTSLRSAVETVAIVKDPEQRQKLMSIIQDDVKRLDRLISEISGASRLDAELARAQMEPLDMGKVLTALVQVYEATNLKVLENRSYRNYTEQPHRCHMQFFRQVLSPLGMYNCPVYRNQPHGFLGTKEAYADEERNRETRRKTAELIRGFDATSECSEVTCLYNHVNWWLEGLIEDPRQLDELEASAADAEPEPAPDYFL